MMTFIKTVQHRGFEITVRRTAQTRFGFLFFAIDNYGEPIGEQIYFQTVDEAVADQVKNLDLCLDQ